MMADARTPIDVAVRDAYLRRLGWSQVPRPTLDTLFALHRAHVERVPYETVWIALGERRGLDLLESARALSNDKGATGRRAGGYCYHLNGGFSLLLEWLGFEGYRHLGGVQRKPTTSQPDPPAGASGNHLALTVSGLDGREWLVDAGLGDGLHEPIALVEGEVVQGPFRFGVRPSDAEPGGWRFDHDPTLSFAGFDYRPGPVHMTEFLERHEHLSTSPDSGFVRVVMAQRRDATGVDSLRGRVLTRIGAPPDDARELATKAEWREALGDVFGMTLRGVAPDAVTALWRRVCTDHDAFARAQQI